MNENIIQTVKIESTSQECLGITTFTFKKVGKIPKPGQFLMVWVPGIDEIPMSISNYNDNGEWSITVRNVGECTEALSKLKVNDYIGVRGPLGNHFILPKQKNVTSFLIGGGIGSAPLRFLALELQRNNYKSIIIEGARKELELIYLEEFKNFQEKLTDVLFCTDDGSFGIEGFASDVFISKFQEYMDRDKANVMIYTCGPEKMMYQIHKYCESHHIPMQASLERVMRCGCGLCGLCAVDPIGLLVCKDGPIFDSKILSQMKDFGTYRRDFTGKKVILE